MCFDPVAAFAFIGIVFTKDFRSLQPEKKVLQQKKIFWNPTLVTRSL